MLCFGIKMPLRAIFYTCIIRHKRRSVNTQKKKREKVSRFLELLFFFYNADMHVV